MSLLEKVDKLYAADLSAEDFIREAYRIILLRDPDPDGLNHHIVRSKESVVESLLQSVEYRALARSGISLPKSMQIRKKILLFGAYGNGNIGDAIQAASVRDHISLINPDLEVWACSELPGLFPYNYARVLPARYLKRPEILSEFAAIVIGGGGLLAHPHSPLFDIAWQQSLGVPTILLSLGAEQKVSSKSSLLISSSVFVSGRDSASFEALKIHNEDVQQTVDPVLCDPAYAIENPALNKAGKLFILKKTSDEDLQAARRLFNPDIDHACFIEPALDWPVWKVFPEARGLTDALELVSLIDRSELVISTRYHGCILAVCRRTAFIAIREQKSKELCSMLGIESAFFGSFTQLRFNNLSICEPDYQRLEVERLLLRSKLAEALLAAGV